MNKYLLLLSNQKYQFKKVKNRKNFPIKKFVENFFTKTNKENKI